MKFLNYEASINGDLMGIVCLLRHDSKELNYVGMPKSLYHQNGGYVGVTFPEMVVLKENASLKLLVNDDG